MRSPDDATATARSNGLALLIVALVVLLALAIGRGHPLQNLNEGVYARVAQEMLERRDFIVPTLDGVPYLEKPPLLYWVTAASFAAFGSNEAAARVGPLVGELIALGGALWFARRHLAPTADRYALAILGAAPIVVVLAHTLMFDLLFTGLLFAALITAYEACVRPAERRCAPWHILAAAQQPGFAWLYLVSEHLLRFIDARVPHDYHTGPWWYYILRIPQHLFPWILLLGLPIGPTTERAEGRGARLFLWLAFLVPFAMFSLSRAKGEYYMVVGIPALSLLAADRLARATSPGKVLEVMAGAWLIVVVALLALGRSLIGSYSMPANAIILTLSAGALAAISLVMARRGRRAIATLACAAVAIPCVRMYSNFLEANEAAKSARSLASELRGSADPVYVFREFDTLSAFPFYLDSFVGVADPHSGDLHNGLRLSPQPERFPDIPTMSRRAANERLWLVVPNGERESFARNDLAPMFVAVRSVGPNILYASLPLAERRDESSSGNRVASARLERLTQR